MRCSGSTGGTVDGARSTRPSLRPALRGRIPLLGEPDAILRKIREIGMHPMVPMGYVPRIFPRPLVRDPERLTAPDDDGVDWEAAFSAYEYYFALMHHFSTTHGCWHFMMVNEPEYRSGGFYLPAELEKISADLFQKIFIELEDVGLWRLYFRASTRVLASRSGDRMVVSILNLDEVRADAFAVDVAEMGGGYSWAVVRETTQDLSDRVTAEVPVENGRMCVQVPARSLVQVIFSAVDPASITAARIVEQTFTPGTASSLGLYETSRLRLVAKVAGRETDLTGHNIVWTSDDPQFVSVGQGGLLQRVRRTTRTIVVRAALANGTVLAQIPVPPV